MPPSSPSPPDAPILAASEARLLVIGRALRATVDGYVAILLPAYLLELGLGTWYVGLISTATLLGSALMTMAVGAWGRRVHHRRLLRAAALLMGPEGTFITGSDVLMDGGVTASYWYGEIGST